MASKMKSVIRFMQYGFIGMTIFSFSYLLIPVNRGMLKVVVLNFVLHGLFLLAVKALYFAPIDEICIPQRSLAIPPPVLFWIIIRALPATIFFSSLPAIGIDRVERGTV